MLKPRSIAAICAVAGFLVLVVPCPGLLAEETKSTSTYKSVTVERVTTVQEEVQKVKVVPKARYTCALMVKNRARNIDDQKTLVLQDFVAGRLTDMGFTLISHEDVTRAVAGTVKAKSDPNAMDATFDDATSGLRLAQNLNTDYLLSVSISSYGTDSTSYTGHGIEVAATQHRLKLTYRLLDAYHGGSLTAGVVTSVFSDRQQTGLTVKRENVLDDLLDAAANDLSNMLASGARAGAIEAAESATSRPADASFTVKVAVANLSIPQVQRDDKNQYSVTGNTQPIETIAANIELDGVTVGTTPGPINAKPGLHKMQLRRELFRDWEATVFVSDGQTLTVSMQLTDRGINQFKDMTNFFADLKQGQALTDAQVKKIEGYAKMLEQSGIRINATALPSPVIQDGRQERR